MSTNTFYRIYQKSQKEELEDVHYEKNYINTIQFFNENNKSDQKKKKNFLKLIKGSKRKNECIAENASET